jgi:hypothetical protein
VTAECSLRCGQRILERTITGARCLEGSRAAKLLQFEVEWSGGKRAGDREVPVTLGRAPENRVQLRIRHQVDGRMRLEEAGEFCAPVGRAVAGPDVDGRERACGVMR